MKGKGKGNKIGYGIQLNIRCCEYTNGPSKSLISLFLLNWYKGITVHPSLKISSKICSSQATMSAGPLNA